MDEKVERERDKGGEMEGAKMEMCGKDSKEEEEDEDEDEERGKLPGFRFHPTDEELVSFYLKRKVEGRPVEVIGHIDIYKYDPWDLPKVSNVGEKEWYFFCKRGRKYRNSIRPNRVTGSGFWKATGIDKPIHSAEEPRECIGLKKSLVYYRGNAGKGSKTDWMMHEFRLPPTIKNDTTILGPHSKDIAQEAEVWTICRIFKRIPSHRKYTPHSKKHGANTDPVKCSNPADSYSIASSGFESEHSCEQYMSFGDSVTIHPKTESNMLGMDSAFVDDRDSLLLTDHFNSSTAHHQPPFSGSWNPNGDGRVSYRNNWDELGSVVEQGVHHRSHDFDCT